MRFLGRAFFARPAAVVARDLIGKVLVRGRRRARIVEVEAYLDGRDLASHARFGPGGRSAVMFGAPGRLYVYLVYGMHHCLNLVAEADGRAGAVLVRAAEPLWTDAPDLLRGPGKLCRGLDVTRWHDGRDAAASRAVLRVADDGVAPGLVARSPRIGVEYAGLWARRRLRFYLRGHPSVSGRPR